MVRIGAKIGLMLVVLVSNVRGQIPRLETGQDCVDWFLVSWNGLERSHAVAGHSIISKSNSEGFETQDWFEIRFIDPHSNKSYHYCENQYIFANDEGKGFWEKWLAQDQDFMRCYGDRAKPLEKVPPAYSDANGKYRWGGVDARFKTAPNAFTFAMMTGSGYGQERKFGYTYFRDAIEPMEKEELPDDRDGNKVVFLCNNLWSIEYTANPENGMPILTRGFFPDQNKKKGPASRDLFKTLNYESRTKWECLDEKKEIYAPISVDNFVHKTHPLHKNTSHLEIVVAYSVEPLNAELFSVENMALSLKNKGPIADLREKLFKKLRTRITSEKETNNKK